MFYVKCQVGLLFCLLLSVLTSSAKVHSQHENNEKQNRIYGGVPIDIKDFGGFIVQLYYRHGFICGGSLFTRRLVITAAHCLEHKMGNSLSVVGGQSRTYTIAKRVPVIAFIMHPRFDNKIYANDIAVMLLKKKLTGTLIETIPLCTAAVSSGKIVTIGGWGRSEKPHDVLLKVVQIPVITKEKCLEDMKQDFGDRLPKGMTCVTANDERGACFGDSGGPLIYKKRLCGVFSWLQECAGTKYPYGYTTVSYFRPFLFAAFRKLIKYANENKNKTA